MAGQAMFGCSILGRALRVTVSFPSVINEPGAVGQEALI